MLQNSINFLKSTKKIQHLNPPERPIISASGSVRENIGLHVENFIKELAKKHPSFLQDTPDLLRMIEQRNERNEGAPLPPNAVLVTIDVSAFIQTFHIHMKKV